MTPREKAEKLAQELTQALMGRSLLTDIAVPMITHTIEEAVKEATTLRGEIVAVKTRPPLVLEPDPILEDAITTEREACAQLMESNLPWGNARDDAVAEELKRRAGMIRNRNGKT